MLWPNLAGRRALANLRALAYFDKLECRGLPGAFPPAQEAFGGGPPHPLLRAAPAEGQVLLRERHHRVELAGVFLLVIRLDREREEWIPAAFVCNANEDRGVRPRVNTPAGAEPDLCVVNDELT